MDPVDVNPLRTDPDDMPDPVRRAAHKRRYDAQCDADDARSDALDAMTRAGIDHADAVRVTDALIMAVRAADALRLEYARGHLYDRWLTSRFSVEDCMVDFLSATTHAHPVQPTTDDRT